MERILLDGKKMKACDTAHGYLKEELAFPDYYGDNLDALFDCLGDICEKTEITIQNCGQADEKIIRVFRESEDENQQLVLRLKD